MLTGNRSKGIITMPMKKLFFLLLFSTTSFIVFSQNNDLPAFMLELNTGYSVGINLDNAVQIDIKLIYSFERFGFAVEAGSLFSTDYSAFHLFLAPIYYFINADKWRLPLAVGLDFINDKTSYIGIGGVIAIHYRLAKYIYTGFNIGITYAFNNIYDELTGYKTTVTNFDDGTSKTQTTPIYESKNHYGNNFYIKPSLVIGLQF
jgi:hypothetical protein